ncbi:DUF6456 domain-containing protein [Rhizobium sp. SSA_523]|uniref:DUF6456 domain-containing protein n=1 Tax=Rhizobium sp. SSA_523 TaxID=2952477 RepID=UPI002091A865|nr:DUF6456 domain-containing protein [Rhizobium sp. SSA_523]MCO5731934.1 DUF6456 domain-containing protein [Rhizobium sp. SSA_523]WKC22714.1 DUF6456 domain-containing protein [Rhizobium sp. SSA_523]
MTKGRSSGTRRPDAAKKDRAGPAANGGTAKHGQSSTRGPGSAALLALLRAVVKAPCAIEPAEEGSWRLVQPGPPRIVPDRLLNAALSSGLILRREETLWATAETASHLRRALQVAKETDFGDQHRILVQEQCEVEGDRQMVSRNLNESPLGPLLKLKDRSGDAFLPQAAVEAAERLAADFQRAALQPRVTACWEPRLNARQKGERGGMADLTESAAAARRRVGQAIEAMGPELSGVALDVCCFGKGLELVERERGWPVRSAKLMLRTALLALARHYAPPPPQPRRRHAWGGDGFRPAL